MLQDRIENLYAKPAGVKSLAWDLLKKINFPNRKVEAYRKISLKELEEFEVFGKANPKYEVKTSDSRVQVLSIKDAKKTYELFLENRFKERIKNEIDYFALENSAFSEEGRFFFIPPKVEVEEPIVIDLIFEEENLHYLPSIMIYMARDSKAKFVLNYKFLNESKVISNQLLDIYMDRDSSLEFVNNAIFDEKFLTIQSLRSSLKRNSKLSFWSLTKGSKFFKQDFKAELLEENSEVSFKGASELSQNHKSHTMVLIEHKAENARSNQLFKAVLNDSSYKTFEGKIYVHREAQKTAAYQLNNNLLLGDEAQVFTKPNLEIFADDVKASHGATVAKLSEEELFYFQTRGISKDIAKKFLAGGFLDEIKKDIPNWHSIPNS
jgi:Fe-S cluster assembly protein SufD